jgi:hypothetical protein
MRSQYRGTGARGCGVRCTMVGAGYDEGGNGEEGEIVDGLSKRMTSQSGPAMVGHDRRAAHMLRVIYWQNPCQAYKWK